VPRDGKQRIMAGGRLRLSGTAAEAGLEGGAMAGVSERALQAEAVVVGAGPAGLTAAITLAAGGVPTVLVAPPHRADNRTTALLAGSVAILDALGVWPRCRNAAAPLRAIRIIDDRGGPLRAPEVTFAAREIELDAFGYNIENRYLLPALEEVARGIAALTITDTPAVEIMPGAAALTIRLADERCIVTKLAVGADGHHSLCRRAAGVVVERWAYPQTALTCNLEISRPHDGISTEFHTATGPFTLVPLQGRRASLVWVGSPDDIARLAALDDAALARAIERQSHSIHGKLRLISERGLFPLAGMQADPVAARRIALVGEAAHVMPPIGAQGLNLGLRDVAAIGALAVAAHRAGEDIGTDALLAEYEARRRGDIGMRMRAVDLLNRSLLHPFLPMQAVRGLGLHLVDRIGPLRRAMMRAGVAAGSSDHA
jgi:2-octaprenyl-6-methoxyphenol hydroxylase